MSKHTPHQTTSIKGYYTMHLGNSGGVAVYAGSKKGKAPVIFLGKIVRNKAKLWPYELQLHELLGIEGLVVFLKNTLKHREDPGFFEKPPKEHKRICNDCKKTLWLSVEGHRCARCSSVFCLPCGVRHFAAKRRHRR